MSPSAKKILEVMAREEKLDNYQDAEIVCDGWQCYLKYTRVRGRTILELLRLCVISETNEGGKCRRYTINEMGKALLRRPELESEISVALLRGGSFTVKNDQLVSI